MDRAIGVLARLALGLVVATSASPTAAGAQVRVAQVDTSYGCIVCHADKRRAFVTGVHAERGIRCHDCHGGTPTAFETRSAHTPRFVGHPGKMRTVAICASCHADPNRMRQYGLPAGQLAELRTSRHGQLLLERGDTAAPTCTDCHDAHTILPPVDARSSVYPANIPATCGRCHEDARRMAGYGIPTSQLAEFTSSAHGVALFRERNFAAPTCIGCHGSHAALPPRVVEIANVCGRCHELVDRAFEAGPHAAPARLGRLPGCIACHSNHGTERVPPEQLSGLCVRCHAEGSPAAQRAQQVQQEIVRVRDELRAAAAALEELVRAGEPVTDTRFRYRTAQTYYEQLGLVQHSLDLERLNDLTRRTASIARDIRAAAETRRERRWEHRLFLIPVWFLALAAVTVAGFKLADLRRHGE